MLFLLPLRIRYRKNGAPDKAAIIPIGSSSGATITRERKSASTVNNPPKTITNGNTIVCRDPTILLAICGTTSPIKPITPLTETTIPVNTAAMMITTILILVTLTPRFSAVPSPKSSISSSLVKRRMMQTVIRKAAATYLTFSQLAPLKEPTIQYCESGMAVNVEEALEIAKRIGYPLMVRPSYVLGGRGMEVVYDDESLEQYMKAAVGVTPDRPILIDRFLNNAMECEADAISDGETVFVPAVMEHIELAGIHSGDSACILPSKHIPIRHLETIKEYTKKIAKEMNVRGLMNMQYAIADDKVYVLEANPRASRTVPLVSKVCNINMVKIATDIVTRELTGRPSPVPTLTEKKIPHIGVKQAVFPFNMFPEVDPVLGPEMRSTGEVLGIASSYGAALYKAEEGAKTILPTEGKVLISVSDLDKPEVVELAQGYYDAGFTIVATGNTYNLIKESGIPVEKIKKIHEGRPNISDALTNGELAMIINTPHGKQSAHDDSYIRKAAIKMRIPYMTNIAAAKASLEGIMEMKIHGSHEVKSLQEYHLAIK